MTERPGEDPRIPLIAAVLAIGETPAGRMLCERFLNEARGLDGQSGPIPAGQLQEVVSPGVASAIEGVAVAFSMASDHLDFLAKKAAGRFAITPPRR